MAYNRKDNTDNIQIFRLHRIKFEEMWNDAKAYIRETYNASDEEFTIASPFAQLLSVILHLGRMILYYIEDSITGLNITTAFRPDQIRGLATLTGHDPARSIAARGSVKIQYNNQAGTDMQGEIVYIPNKTKILNKATGLQYVLLFSADNARMTLRNSNMITGGVAQGSLKYQQITSSGLSLQSFNFKESNYQNIDQYFINVYVNGEPWDIVPSLVDLSYGQHGCVVRTGQLGGVDVFFGNLTYGAIPPLGATILVEYLVTAGAVGNWAKEVAMNMDFWAFDGEGFLKDGTTVDLNEYFNIIPDSDIIFGTDEEDVALTQKIAPYVSRSMVLGNAINYEYFLKRLNMFSDIQIIQGFERNTTSDIYASRNQVRTEYENALRTYKSYVEYYGENSDVTKPYFDALKEKRIQLDRLNRKVRNYESSNNTVYLMLVPDIRRRLGDANYFTCNETLFTLRDDEKTNILDLIEASGQRILTVDNVIIDPIQPRFAVNVRVRIWDNYTFDDIYAMGLSALSTYFINNKRKDRIPISDIISLFENLNPVDSVSASFDADERNKAYYGDNYGIDQYGDVILTRNINDNIGNTVKVKDMYPLFRGGFTSPTGTQYSDVQDPYGLSGFNLIVVGSSKSRKLSLEGSTPMN